MKAGDRVYLEGEVYEVEASMAGIMEHQCELCEFHGKKLCDMVENCPENIRFRLVKQEKKKVYISGQITGLEKGKSRKEFERAESEIRRMGFEPVNPWKNGLTNEASYGDHIRADLKMLAECDMIYMLRGWEYSNGARLEHSVACACGMEILKYE